MATLTSNDEQAVCGGEATAEDFVEGEGGNDFVVSNKRDFFHEVAEVREALQKAVQPDLPSTSCRETCERIGQIWGQYQEQPGLLDPFLEEMVEPLMGAIAAAVHKSPRNATSALPNLHLLSSLLYLLTTVRGYKTVSRFFPHEAADLEPCLEAAEEEARAGQNETWSTLYCLTLWLAMVLLTPFDLKVIDSGGMPDSCCSRFRRLPHLPPSFAMQQMVGTQVMNHWLAPPMPPAVVLGCGGGGYMLPQNPPGLATYMSMANMAPELTQVKVASIPAKMATDASPWTGISAGSHGHPEMCHRPCVYMFKSGFCHLGSFCDHCHLRHEGPSLLKLDKKQRSKLKELSREDVMALLLPHIRHRVARNGLGPQTLELVQFLEAESIPDPVISADLLPRELDRLNRVLSRLPFSALVKIFPHSAPEKVIELFERSRFQLGAQPIAITSSGGGLRVRL
eukprot:s815_g14.t1